MKLPRLKGIEDACRRIRPYLPETPLVRSEVLSRAFAAEVWLKNETVSPIASFKLRGALCEVLRARDVGFVQGVVTSSTGNHGQGVAFAARQLGISAEVFLPVGANPLKKAMIRALGAVIRETGRDLDEAKTEARAFAAAEGRLFVDDGDGLGVIEGAGTLALEAARTLPRIDAMFVPMGSGALASGCAAAVKALHPRARVIAVQSTGAPAMVESFRAGRPVERPVQTLADGLVCRVPAPLALDALLALLDDALLATDEELLAAMHTLVACAHVLTEPAGAAALAGAWQMRHALTGQTVVFVLSGANVTSDLLRRALAERPFCEP